MDNLERENCRSTHQRETESHHSRGHGAEHRNHLTLFDVAKDTLKAHHTPIRSSDEIYHKLNSMMVAHHHTKADIDHRTHINDHMLPKSWNHVDPRSIIEHSHHGHGGDGSQHHPHPHYPRPVDENGTVPHPTQPHERAYPAHVRHAYRQQADSGLSGFGDAIGGIIGGIGAGLLSGVLNRHSYGGYHRPYYGGAWNGGYGGGWNGGYGGGWNGGYGGGWNGGYGGDWNGGYGNGWNNGYGGGWNRGYRW